MISERFKASTHGFCHFGEKFKSASRSCHYRACPDNLDPRVTPEDDKCSNINTSILGHALNVNHLSNVILGFIPRIHAEHLANVILGFIPRIHADHYPLLDTRVKPEYDGNKRQCFVSEDDKGMRLSTSILNQTLNVILGFIPRIHTEHYSLDTRVTPEYDYKQSLTKGLDVVCQCAALLERLKTHIKIPPLFCHPRAWLLARPEDLDSRVKPENDQNNLLPQCAPDATGFLSDVYKRGTRVRKTQAVTRQTNECIETAESGVDKVVSSCEKNPNVHKTYMNFLRQRKTALDAPLHAVSSGRSMIEMLGVLAIIGVLSVGGIQGFSKAIEKFNINQAINEYNTVIFGLIEHLDDFIKIGINDKKETGLANEFTALNLIPNNWKQLSDRRFKDSLGNYFDISDSAEGNRIFINLWMGEIQKNQQNSSISDTFSTKLCAEIFSNLAQPLHEILHFAIVFRYPADGYTKYFMGDKYCTSGIRCIKNMNFNDFYDICNSCNLGNELCTISLSFKP